MPPKPPTNKLPPPPRTEMDMGEEDTQQGEALEEKQSDMADLKLRLQQQEETIAKLMRVLGAGTGVVTSTSSPNTPGGQKSPRQQSTTVPIQQVTQLPTVEEPLPRLKGIEPKQLNYTEASQLKVLEDWFFDVERMLKQQRKLQAPFDAQIDLISTYWDREIARRIDGRMEEMKAMNDSIQSWKDLQKLLRSQFLSTVDESTAVTELRSIQMPQTESMETYVQRGSAITDRISEKRMTSETKAELLIAGVNPVRFPLLVAAVNREQEELIATVAGKGMNLNATRNRLIQLAKSEPTEVATMARLAAGRNNSSTQSQTKPPSRWPQRPQTTTSPALTQKLNAIGINLETSSSSSSTTAQTEQHVTFTSEEVRQLLNAVGSSSEKKWPCGRCRKSGHTTRECRAPDTRTCYNCGETGHIKPNCQKPKKDTTSGSGPEGEKSKNA
jgi:hypothetical protein